MDTGNTHILLFTLHSSVFHFFPRRFDLAVFLLAISQDEGQILRVVAGDTAGEDAHGEACDGHVEAGNVGLVACILPDEEDRFCLLFTDDVKEGVVGMENNGHWLCP